MRVSTPRVLCIILLLVAAPHLAVYAADCCSISGVVSTPSGQPATSLWVALLQDGDEKGKSLTGDDGRYYIAGMDSGSYEIVVRHKGKVRYSGRVQLPNDKKFDIQLSN